MLATVIIPTTGSPEVRIAIESVLNQTQPTACYLVCDGDAYFSSVKEIASSYGSRISVCYLPINVGSNGFYGHRIYAAFSHLINTEYLLYLDQDNWMNLDHVEKCIDLIQKNSLDWCYSLRTIVSKDGERIALDNCESLGKWPVFSGDYNHIDTNCYCLKTDVAIKISQAWHGGWGQDRVWFQALAEYFPNYDTTGKYTLNYRIGGNKDSVKKDFFDYGNQVMEKRYGANFPWDKQHVKS